MGIFKSLIDKKGVVLFNCIVTFYLLFLIVGSLFSLSESTLNIARGFAPLVLLLVFPILLLGGKLLPETTSRQELGFKTLLRFIPTWLKVLTLSTLVYEVLILITLESSLREVKRLQMSDMKMEDILHYFGLFMFFAVIYFSIIQAHLKYLDNAGKHSST